MVKLQSGFERVQAVYNYVDEPRSGVADYNGEPHWFENIFDQEHDDYSDNYWLTLLSPEAFAAVRQQTEIFSRWRHAFDSGEVDLSTHPALPQDAEAYKDLEVRIRNEIIGKVSERFKVHGTFSLLGIAAQSRELSAFQVQWSS